jgi:16S rRNA (guanine966-N2)-methyltransferase
MKIISGKYKNRVITTPKGFLHRPSTSKFREALFSILSSGQFINDNVIENAKVLDLYSGTGSLSFEAISRGASSVTMVDISKEYLDSAISFAKQLGEEVAVKTLCLDARYLPQSNEKFNLVFMDPPYHNELISKTINSLQSKSWLEDGALIALEMGKKEKVEIPLEFVLVKEKLYGNIKLVLVRYEPK